MTKFLTLEAMLPFITGGPFPLLDQVCDVEHLLDVAEELTQWRSAAPRFGFSPAAIEDLDSSRHDDKGKRQLMLQKWAESQGQDATYRALASLLLKVEKRSLAENLLRWSNERNRSKKTASSKQQKVIRRNYKTLPEVNAYNRDTSTFRSTIAVARTPSGDRVRPPQQPFSGRNDVERQSVDGAFPLSSPESDQMNIEKLAVALQSHDSSSSSSEMVSMTMPFYPPEIREKVVAIEQKASLCSEERCSELRESTTDMMKLTHKVQQLEQEVQISEQRIERLRQENAAVINECKERVELLKKQLHKTESALEKSENTKKAVTAQLERMSNKCANQQSMMQNVQLQLQQMTIHSKECLGRNCTNVNCPFKGVFSSSTVGGVQADSGEEEECNVLDELCHSMERCFVYMEKRLKEQVMAEVATHQKCFLQVNSRMKDIVSRTLECLSGINCSAATELQEDLHWLLSRLDYYKMPKRTSSLP